MGQSPHTMPGPPGPQNQKSKLFTFTSFRTMFPPSHSVLHPLYLTHAHTPQTSCRGSSLPRIPLPRAQTFTSLRPPHRGLVPIILSQLTRTPSPKVHRPLPSDPLKTTPTRHLSPSPPTPTKKDHPENPQRPSTLNIHGTDPRRH